MDKVARDEPRIAAIRDRLRQANLYAFVCALPKNVLLLTGSWPVVGKTIAIATAEGWVGLIAPKDEQEFACASWADRVWLYEPASLINSLTLESAVIDSLSEALKASGAATLPLGLETRSGSVPCPYAAIHLFGDSLRTWIGKVAPNAALLAADCYLDGLESQKTAMEIGRIRTACGAARDAYVGAAEALLPGRTEIEVANRLRSGLAEKGARQPGVGRADGSAYCMSGPNGANASAAYQRSTLRELASGDLALLHVNSYVDGFWTDITRTLAVEGPCELERRVLQTISDARTAAMESIRPGVAARDVDAAARRVVETAGFGPAFRHGLGHGVGFAAIDHTAGPVLSPTSEDVIEPGMVFNVEPGIYLDGRLGARHCDMVAVNDVGFELLTDF